MRTKHRKHRHSRGRSRDRDYTQSFASLSLRDGYDRVGGWGADHFASIASMSNQLDQFDAQFWGSTSSHTVQAPYPPAKSSSAHGRGESSRSTCPTRGTKAAPQHISTQSSTALKKSDGNLRTAKPGNPQTRPSLTQATKDESNNVGNKVSRMRPAGHEAEKPRLKQRDPVDQEVSGSLSQEKGSLYSPSTMPKRDSPEDLNTARKHEEKAEAPDCHINRGMDDKTVGVNVEDELHHMDPGIVRDSSCDLTLQVESPWTQEHSSDGFWTHTTETSTPESNPSWLAEYPEGKEELDQNHPLVRCKALVVARLLEAFRALRKSCLEQDVPFDVTDEPNSTASQDIGKGSPTSKDKGQGRSGQKDRGKESDTATRKRTLEDLSGPHMHNTDNNGPSSSHSGPPGKRRPKSDRNLKLACPFAKKDPMSYKACYKYELSRIRDVKQHLARRHRNRLYCPTCLVTFKTETERDDHITKRSCRPGTNLKLERITELQERQLSKKSAPNTTEEAQWFAVFDILFPGHSPRPRSPYVDSELSQDMLSFHDFLTSHGPRIVFETVKQSGAMTSNPLNTEAFMQSVFAEGFISITDQWLACRSSITQDVNMPSSSGSSRQDTPPSSSTRRESVEPISINDSRVAPFENGGSQSGGRSVNAHLDGEDVPVDSSEQIPSGDDLGWLLNMGHGNSDILSGFTYDGSDDELMQLSTAAQASSAF